MVAWDAILGASVAFAILVYALSLRERTQVVLNCAVYAFSSLIAGAAAAVLLTAVEEGMFLPDGGALLGRVIFASFATAVASAMAMSYAYPFDVKPPGNLFTVVYALGLVLAVITLLSPLVIVGSRVATVPEDPSSTPVVYLEFGVLTLPFTLFASVSHVILLRNEWRAWRRAKSDVFRKRARALFLGFLLPGLLTIGLTLLLALALLAMAAGRPVKLELPFNSFVFVVPLIGVGYALARFRLFEGELFLRENVVTIFAFFLGGWSVLLSMAVLQYSVPQMPMAVLLVLGLTMFAVIGAGYPVLRGAAARVIDRIAPGQKWLEFQPVEAYLVKKDSGVLVAHAKRGGEDGPDEDIVSSMLSAIQEFVQSSFGSTEPLREMNLGKRRMLIEYGELLYLAMVYDGRVSEEVRDEIKGGVDRMEAEHGPVLKDWKGRERDVLPLRGALKQVMEGAYARAEVLRLQMPGARRRDE